jgi:hypothetical protein
LKRILIYSALAVILGLVLVLVPLVTLAEIGIQDNYGMPEALYMKLKEVEGARSNMPRFSESDVEVLGMCFVLALAAYVLSRRKMPEHEYRWTGQSPF